MTGKLEGQWSRNGKAAEARELAEAGKLARLHRRKLAKAEREAKAMDAHSRAVGSAVRRAARQQQVRYMGWLTVSPARKSGHNAGKRRLPRFEMMTGATTLASHVGADGLSSFHFSWRSRGLRPRKSQKNNHAYRRGEVVRLVKYILRDAAREIEGGGIVSSISDDPDEIASVLAAAEELEMAAGQANANVYISIVISLPHELDAAGRERVLVRVTEAFREEKLPFAAVLHAPDPGTDQRNYHAHIVTSLRPFRKEADGTYSFAAAASSDLNDGEWIQPMRKRIAQAINEEMAQLEVDTLNPQRIFTHLSHADRGLPPKSKAEGKRGPGRSAEARRAAEVEVAQTEIGLRKDELKLLDELAGLITGLAAHVPLDVPAILRSARKRVMDQAAVATLARANAVRARIAAMSRPGQLRLANSAKLRSLDERTGREGGSATKATKTLDTAPSLAKVPTLSAIPTLGNAREIPGVTRRTTRVAAATPTTGAAHPTASTSGLVQSPSDASSAINPQVTRAPSTGVAGGASAPSAAQIEHRPASLARALATATTMPFLPLRPEKLGDQPLRYLINETHAVSSDIAALRLIRDHQQHPAMQQLLQAAHARMLQTVLDRLITRPIKPQGDVTKMFDHDPQLAAAVRTAWGHRSLTDIVDQARAVWSERAKAAALAEEGLTAEELLQAQNQGKGRGGR